MDYARTFADVHVASHDPNFEVTEVVGSPDTLQVGSIETGLKLIKIIGFPAPDLVMRAAAFLKLSDLPLRPRQCSERARAAVPY